MILLMLGMQLYDSFIVPLLNIFRNSLSLWKCNLTGFRNAFAILVLTELSNGGLKKVVFVYICFFSLVACFCCTVLDNTIFYGFLLSSNISLLLESLLRRWLTIELIVFLNTLGWFHWLFMYITLQFFSYCKAGMYCFLDTNKRPDNPLWTCLFLW